MGWSFPQGKVSTSPLPAKPFNRSLGINFSLLHCDYHGGASPYALVNSLDDYAKPSYADVNRTANYHDGDFYVLQGAQIFRVRLFP